MISTLRKRNERRNGLFPRNDCLTAGLTYRSSEDCEGLTERSMLNLVVTLLIIALIAALLGFGGIASAAVGIAKIIFFVVIVLFLIAVLAGALGRGASSL